MLGVPREAWLSALSQAELSVLNNLVIVLNRAQFGRWALRDEAAQHRLALLSWLSAFKSWLWQLWVELRLKAPLSSVRACSRSSKQ